MSQYDDYFTNEDKPFVENFNDALLISNVFDYTVDIELPKMFSNSQWADTNSPRKAGVSIVKINSLTDMSISTDQTTEKSILVANSNSSKMYFEFYPNFNSFGRIKSISWICDNDNVECFIADANGGAINLNVSNGATLNDVGLKTLQNFRIGFNFTGADVLRSITVRMENKQQTRYGANVKISTVDGLQSTIDDIEDDITDLNSYAKNNFTLNGHSVDGYYRNKNKIIVDAEPTGLRSDALYATGIHYPPIRPFMTPIIVNWEENDVMNYGVATLYCSSSSGKLIIKIIPISADVPSTFRACLNFEYLYDAGGQ